MLRRAHRPCAALLPLSLLSVLFCRARESLELHVRS